ncbi:ketopantoate reductase family protein [Roseinatronobacter alkalisoli]|uniref:2-dehydropantoate 2-reductase n=1 Tax=Roseinatronobacter alkalisoli TaxID=3028235 RepID=A0ABT5TCB1_9RHOB|nr:2-dehydropantoate 2-reductase [Roseinatronobacter sp. HJB301]MDD7972760.1 2-dehydropantoate 2-reductase [Roseinatronobacter sp. HJB301]
MRVAILGAGATGGLLAVALSEAGHDVSILVRGPHLDAIRANGLCLRDPSGQETVIRLHATDDPVQLGPQDVLISTLKAPALAQVISGLPAYLRDCPIIMAMNGVFWWYGVGFQPHDRPLDCTLLDPGAVLAGLLDATQIQGAIIYATNQVVAPGVVQNRSATNRFAIGGPVPSDLSENLAASLCSARVEFTHTGDIRYQMWHKLLRNLSSAPISVLTGARVREINQMPDTARLARALFLEGADVARSHGFDGLADDVDQVIAPGKGALQVPSMRQDFDLGRPMEIDSMLRIVQHFARGAGVATPVLDVVLPLVVLAAQTAGCYPRPT